MNYVIKGIGGGGPAQKNRLCSFSYICCSPIFRLSKMGSNHSQLSKLFVLQGLSKGSITKYTLFPLKFAPFYISGQ